MGVNSDLSFKRGPGPLVSFLVPTRARPRLLAGAIDSIVTLASDASRVEVLLRVDDDDQMTLGALEGIVAAMRPAVVKAFIAPRGAGYREAHVWLDDLARQATGDWVMFWGDDSRMVQPCWDAVLASCRGGYEDEVFASVCTNPSRQSSEFFFIRRRVFEVLGHWSRSPHVDTWILSILTLLDRVMKNGIRIEHFNDYLGDQVSTERRVVCNETSIHFSNPDMIRLRIEDAQSLVRHIEGVAVDRRRRGVIDVVL